MNVYIVLDDDADPECIESARENVRKGMGDGDLTRGTGGFNTVEKPGCISLTGDTVADLSASVEDMRRSESPLSGDTMDLMSSFWIP